MKNSRNVSAKIAIVWKNNPGVGKLQVFHGKLDSLAGVKSGRSQNDGCFNLGSSSAARLEAELADQQVNDGAFATRITVRTDQSSFTFLLRDVLSSSPLFIPMYSVAVTTGKDKRTYQEIAKDVRAKKLVSDWRRMEELPEETYQDACNRNRKVKCPTWLGLSRDVRIFQVDSYDSTGYWGWVRPMYHSKNQTVPETDGHPLHISFEIGRGAACRVNTERRLDQGVLPIVLSTQQEEDITYHVTAFASLETQPVTAVNHRGTDWMAAYANVGGNKLGEEKRKSLAALLHKEIKGRKEELICCIRVVAANDGSAPQYAWFKGAQIRFPQWGLVPSTSEGETFDAGKSVLKDSTVCAINRMNGQPMPQREMAVLVAAGQSAVFEMIIPHSPISLKRAEQLMKIDIDEHLEGARKFWNDKLQSGARINVPEKAVDERIRACLLNCDVNTLGLAAKGPLLATVGCYGPIGSESSPMIQFFDSMGWHDVAERSLDFFLNLQRDDGFIQTYDAYELETGPVLWTMGEHYRYTCDKKWLKRVTPKIIKACDYTMNWRQRNMKEELRGKGYGMINGRVGDPEDYFHQFMLNGLAYLGLARSVEMLAETAPKESKRLAAELQEYKKDIRDSLFEAIAYSPVIPFGDGSWIPTAPSWPGYPGALSLYAEGGQWWTHGTFSARDSLCGPVHLILSEVVDPREPAGEILLKYHQRLYTVENAGLSQPYYCRHDFAHLKRDEVKLFLKAYYNQFTSLQDRQTYTFWEHYYHASSNKTHEAGWFLMQTRWMLYMETDQSLNLLRAIPRSWMENGKTITVEKAATYFGPLSFSVESKLGQGRIEAVIECPGERKPQHVSIRLPHPQNRIAKSCKGGTYDPGKECVRVDRFDGKARIELSF